MYAYCGNNPVSRADSKGEWWGIAILAVLFVGYIAVNAGLAESNYNNNSQLDSSLDTSTENRIIDSQNSSNIEQFDYGFFSASYNGCEAIAIHNIKVLLGKKSSLSETIGEIQATGGMWLLGVFGSNPYRIPNVLSSYGIPYSAIYSPTEMTAEGLYVISYWNKNNAGIHTVAIKYDENGYYAYNKGKNKTSNPSTYASNFICGYYMGKG